MATIDQIYDELYRSYLIHNAQEIWHQQNKMIENGGWKFLTLEPNLLSKEEFIKEFKSNIEFRKKWGYKMDINSKTGHYIDAIIDDGGISEQLKNK